jgi:hypothetical protein
MLLDIMSDRVGQGNVLATWADSTAPPSTSLFKGDAASTVKARGATSDD